MLMDKQLYSYKGPVTEFGRCISNNWSAQTWAVSPSKAKSNLIFRFKQENNRLPSAKIELVADVIKEES